MTALMAVSWVGVFGSCDYIQLHAVLLIIIRYLDEFWTTRIGV